MHWYYSKNGTQLGPVEQAELITKMASGEVAPSDLVWKEGMADWLPSGQIGELRAQMPVSQPQPMGAAPSPYSAPVTSYSTEVIPSYLWQSIVVTILCCWPFGIPAIVYAAKVDGLVARGQFTEAQEASRNAKMWAWISFGSWFVVVGLYLIFIIMVGVRQS